jgi:hypothetical protein
MEHTHNHVSLRRFAWGGAGALAPILTSLLMLDVDNLSTYIQHAFQSGGELYELLGYSVRIALLFLVGGIWAFLHKMESDPKKLFQLGIVAPAMITGMINASNVREERLPAAPDNPPAISFSLSLISSAYAETDEETQPKPEEPSPGKKFIKGLFGR